MKKILFKRLTVKEEGRVFAGITTSDRVITTSTVSDCPAPDFERLTIGSGCFKPYTMNAQTCTIVIEPNPDSEQNPTV